MFIGSLIYILHVNLVTDLHPNIGPLIYIMYVYWVMVYILYVY